MIAAKPELPGVWRRRDGGFRVRGRATDPRTGKLREINWALPQFSRPREAFAWLQTELDKVRAGATTNDAPQTAPRFHEYAADVFARKLALGRIRSEAGKAKWSSVLKKHLVPAFGDIYVDQLQPSDVKAWQSKVASRIKANEMAPTSANTILGVLRQITDEAMDDFDIRDPLRGVDPFDTREHSTYTEEEPNSLAPSDVPLFLSKLRDLHPDHYAFAFLGITTGLRPSSLRPLRRSGESADIKWKEGLLLIRRSQTIGDVVMETTKTDLHQRLTLPPEVLDVLRWHVDERLTHKRMRESDLLFPATTGRFRARSVLDKPFAEVCQALKLCYRFTPRGMRRTYQDLARAAGVHDAVTRAISGHATPTMQLHYSTARGHEVRRALANIADIATGATIIDLDSARRSRAATAPTRARVTYR
ncbi:MAG: site-specific integrase [Myxococcales bacterium]|nr:site-specific integrase [Myxococcales bacterium]